MLTLTVSVYACSSVGLCELSVLGLFAKQVAAKLYYFFAYAANFRSRIPCYDQVSRGENPVYNSRETPASNEEFEKISEVNVNFKDISDFA